MVDEKSVSVENTISKTQFEQWFADYLDSLTKGIKTSDGAYLKPLETDIIPKEINDIMQVIGGSSNSYQNAAAWASTWYLGPMMQARESLFAVGGNKELLLMKPGTKSIPNSGYNVSGYKQDGQTYYAYKDEAINRYVLTDPKDFLNHICIICICSQIYEHMQILHYIQEYPLMMVIILLI